MNKALLLTKSNLRKNRGTSVGLFLLMVIATCLIGISLLIFMDCYPSVSREAVRLNGGDGYISIAGNVEGFTDEKIAELFDEDTDSYYVYHDLKLTNHPIAFGNGEVVISVDICDDAAFTRPMNTFEVITEDTSITEDYVYLPYQFYTSGGFNTGDTFEITNSGKTYSYKVRGFTNVVYGGCNNTALFALVVDNDSYEELWNDTHEEYENINVIFDLKDGVKNGKFRIKAFNELLPMYGITRSMSRAGTPTDNAAMEAINGWIKAEMFMDLHITGEKPVKQEVDDYITFFNEQRPAYSLNYLTPKQYREFFLPIITV